MPQPPISAEYDPPAALVEACAAGDCVLYAGAGLSARANFPTYHCFLEKLILWARENKFTSPDSASIYQAGLDDNDLASTADGIVSELASQGKTLEDYLKGLFLRDAPLSDAHNVLGELPFCAALTTNFDTLIEKTFIARNPPIGTPRDVEMLLGALHKKEFFVLKLYGDLARPDSVMISPSQFYDAVRENLPFSQLMEALFFSKTFLFLGASLEGIDDYLKGISLRKQTDTNRQHFALVGLAGEGWRAKAHSLERRYGIRVLRYLRNDQHWQMNSFLFKLRREITPTQKSGSAARLKRVRLENIGPFEVLDLSLDTQWNILLGDNGVGKSVVLKAIATAICGRDAQPYAARLVKAGKRNAMITLETESSVYKTEIQLPLSGPAEVTSIGIRLLDAENWLSLGFPPLRTGSWTRPKSADRTFVGLPIPDDILPLIAGGPDPRLDSLKWWIVNLDHRSKTEQLSTGGDKYGKIINHLFEVLGQLTEGVKIERWEVDPITFEITVQTDDGRLPIEAVSQGTTSLIGWVGIVLQRLYEIYDTDENPLLRYALVLMDEIDAHLHPSWQQSLVFQLGKIFPNIQFVASTHSPLIVAGMPPEQVFRLERDEDGRVVRVDIQADMIQGRTDQILTTPLFGLKTTLDRKTQVVMDDYATLLGKRERTIQEEEAFQELRSTLQIRVPLSNDMLVERRQAVREAEILSKLVEEKSVEQVLPRAPKKAGKVKR